jgi:hypothetical protein
MYNVCTCDHAMCPHFYHPLWDTFVTSFQVCCDYYATTCNLIKTQIHM